jgi:negative regulator of flagellin synthesis FlgM
MNIEINGPNGRAPAEIADNRKTEGQTGKDTATGSPTLSGGKGDKLSLTSEATQLKALEDRIAELPVVDTQRVTAVQRSLATGTFQIDPAQVADKMLRFEAAMGGQG